MEINKPPEHKEKKWNPFRFGDIESNFFFILTFFVEMFFDFFPISLFCLPRKEINCRHFDPGFSFNLGRGKT